MVFLLLVLLVPIVANAQKLIEYESGMGSRDPNNSDVWVLYQGVKATHEGMILYADSATLNTKLNDFWAYGNVKIKLTDTTTVYGNELYYDGNSRVVNIWGNSATFIDGATTLTTPQLTYDRYADIATYSQWGHAVNGINTLDSRFGRYNSITDEFFIQGEVVLQDTTARLETNQLYYNTTTSIATIVSPTHIYRESTVIYSEQGYYNTETDYAESYKASHITTPDKQLRADTIYFDQRREFGKAMGNVYIEDTVNNLVSTGHYGETNREDGYTYVTNHAMVVMVDNGDSLYLHADTIWVRTDSLRELAAVQAYWHVKVFRTDAQALCDSIYYAAKDSTATLYGTPTLWYNNYQCSADTVVVQHDSSHVKIAHLCSNGFVIEKVDDAKFNQIKGKQGTVYFAAGEPHYADVIGNAQMVYFITDDESGTSTPSLIGANVGVGSQMRIYFKDRKPARMVTMGQPDMHTYPPSQLPEEWRRLTGFSWKADKRPQKWQDIFKW